MKKIRLIFILPILFICSCAIQRGLIEENLVVSIETTPCMGDCPVYRLEIYGNGMVLFEGKEHVERIGSYTGRISRKELKGLRLAFEEAGFFSLEDEYVEPWTDRSTTWVYYSDGTRQKKIKDYSGAPEALKKLEEKVLEMINGVEWTKRDESDDEETLRL